MKSHTFRAEPQRQPECPVSLRERWQGCGELELVGQQLELQQSRTPLRQLFSFLSRLCGGGVLF